MQEIKTSIKRVGSYRLLYVMATQAEYGPALRERIEPLLCHVGPVEAALNLTRYLATNSSVDLVVSLGSAGSSTLEQTGIYQASEVSYRDMDASPLGFEKGVTPFLDLPAKITIHLTIPKLPSARLSTGANIVSGEAYEAVDADMVDMESWALLRVCQRFEIPMIGLRGISDGKEPLKEYSDWARYLDVIDRRLATAIDKVEKALLDGMLIPSV